MQGSNSTFIIDRNNSQALKAVCCVLIVLHHSVLYHTTLYGEGIYGVFLDGFFKCICGYVPVAIFFFLSAYGITESENIQHLGWRDFLKRRMCRVYVPFVLTNILFLVGLAFCKKLEYSDTLLSIVGIKLIDIVTWFVPVLLLFYIFAYILTYVKQRRYKTVGMVLLTIAYVASGITIFNIPFYAIVSVPAFVIGYVSSLYKSEINAVLKHISIRYVVMTVSLILVVVLSAMMMQYIKVSDNAYHFVVAANNVFISLLLVAVFTGRKIAWFRLDWLGKISYEVYLVHAKVFVIGGVFFGLALPWILILILPISFVVYLMDNAVLSKIK